MEKYSFYFSAANATKYTNKLDEKSEIVQSKIQLVFWGRSWISRTEVSRLRWT